MRTIDAIGRAAKRGKRVPGVAGADELLDLIAILADRKRTEAAIAELKELRDEIAGSADDAASLKAARAAAEREHARAESDAAEARRILAEASNKAAAMISNAEQRIQSMRDAAVSRAAELGSMRETLEERIRMAKSAGDAAVRASEQSATAQAEAERVKAEAEKMRAEYKARLAKLNAAMR